MSQETGWDAETKLLYYIDKQLDILIKVFSKIPSTSTTTTSSTTVAPTTTSTSSTSTSTSSTSSTTSTSTSTTSTSSTSTTTTQAPENFIPCSNEFGNYSVWQESGALISRTQEVDDSWTLGFGATASLITEIPVSENTQYTISFEFKVVPTDLTLTIYSMPGFSPLILFESPIFPDTNGVTFVRVPRTFTTAAAVTGLYVVMNSVTGGNVEIQEAQLNTGPIPKPYIEIPCP